MSNSNPRLRPAHLPWNSPGLARWTSSKKTTTLYIGEQILTGFDDEKAGQWHDWGNQCVLLPIGYPGDPGWRPNKGVVLLSYNTPVMVQDNEGEVYQIKSSFSNTTARHKRRAALLSSKGPVKTVSYWEFLGKLAEVNYQGLNGWLDQISAGHLPRWQFLSRSRMSPRQALELLRGQLESIESVKRGRALLERHAQGGELNINRWRGYHGIPFWRPEILEKELSEMNLIAGALEKIAEGESTLAQQQDALNLLESLR